jgi:hypothetical protein
MTLLHYHAIHSQTYIPKISSPSTNPKILPQQQSSSISKCINRQWTQNSRTRKRKTKNNQIMIYTSVMKKVRVDYFSWKRRSMFMNRSIYGHLFSGGTTPFPSPLAMQYPLSCLNAYHTLYSGCVASLDVWSDGRFPRTNVSTILHDAHIYIFKKWVLDLICKNGKISSLRNDLLPLLAKMQWQSNLRKREGIDESIPPSIPIILT